VNKLMKAFPDDEPASAFILLAEDRMIRNFADSEVVHEQSHETLCVSECRIEQLFDQEGDEKRSLVGRRSSRPSHVLPIGKVIRELSDGFQT